MQSRALQQTLVFSTSSQRWPPNLKQPYPRLKTVKEIDTQNRNLRRKYSQTWANDHLRIATTCQQRPPFCGPILSFYNIKLPLNSDHLSTMATICGSQGWSLYTGLTVHKIIIWHFFYSCCVHWVSKEQWGWNEVIDLTQRLVLLVHDVERIDEDTTIDVQDFRLRRQGLAQAILKNGKEWSKRFQTSRISNDFSLMTQQIFEAAFGTIRKGGKLP